MIGVSRRSALGWSLFAPLARVALAGDVAVAESVDDLRFTGWGSEPLSYLTIAPYYLSPAELAAVTIPPPPLNSSSATRADLDELLRLEAARSDLQRASITRHLDYAPMCAHFAATAGRTLAGMPETRALLDHVQLDVRWVVFQTKKQFARIRPDRLEPRLHPCLPVPAHPAYPSSHAAQGALLGRVLGLLAPEAALALTELGLQIGREREIAGVHYPSDGVAGRTLAEGVFVRLQGNARFAAELSAARGEWLSPRR